MGSQQQNKPPKPPKFAKDYEAGLKTQLKYAPRMAQREYDIRRQFDPQYIAQQQALQQQFGPTQYRQQLQARNILDPEGAATYGALQANAARYLGQGYVDPLQNAAYQAGLRGTTGEYLRGGQADPELLRQIQQGIRGRQSGNALAGGNAPAMSEAVYTGQRLQQLKQQRFQNLAAAQGWQTPEAQAMVAGLGAQSARGPIQDIMGIQGVQVPSASRYVNPYAGLQGVQFGLQNYQNQLAYNQLGGAGGSSNPWMGALQGAGQGATMGSVGGPYGAAGGAIVGGVAGGFGYPQYSSIKLKTDVKKVGERNGLDIVEFRYKGRQVHYRGVIAEQVQQKYPEAVGSRNGYLTVDYDKIGIPMERVCKECKQFKPLTDFHKAHNGAERRRSRCRECDNARARDFIDRYRTQWQEYHTRYYRENKQKYQIQSVMRLLGCDFSWAVQLAAIRENGTVCDICGQPPDKRGLVLDHCHNSRKFRGFLCRPCNTGLGIFGDNPTALRKAADYLEKEHLTFNEKEVA